jgi:hypothetical protein
MAGCNAEPTPGSYTTINGDLEAPDASMLPTAAPAPSSPPPPIERVEDDNGAVPHPLMALPDELLLNVASHLSIPDLYNLCLTSKHLGAVAQEALYKHPMALY